MTNDFPPLTPDEKWRVTCHEFFALPVLPSTIDIEWISSPKSGGCVHLRSPIDGYTDERDYRAPRLAHVVYKAKLAPDYKWWIVHRGTADWENARCFALVYRPVVRVRMPRLPQHGPNVAADIAWWLSHPDRAPVQANPPADPMRLLAMLVGEEPC